MNGNAVILYNMKTTYVTWNIMSVSQAYTYKKPSNTYKVHLLICT